MNLLSVETVRVISGKELYDEAHRYLGMPGVRYRFWGIGNSPEGFDCSGMVQHVLKSMGALPANPYTGEPLRHTEEFFDFFGCMVHDQARQTGDLVFFSRNGLTPTHVGIYVAHDQVLHSPGKDGTLVRVDGLDRLCEEPIVDSQAGQPQLYFRNPIGYKRPALPLLSQPPGERKRIRRSYLRASAEQ